MTAYLFRTDRQKAEMAQEIKSGKYDLIINDLTDSSWKLMNVAMLDKYLREKFKTDKVGRIRQLDCNNISKNDEMSGDETVIVLKNIDKNPISQSMRDQFLEVYPHDTNNKYEPRLHIFNHNKKNMYEMNKLFDILLAGAEAALDDLISRYNQRNS